MVSSEELAHPHGNHQYYVPIQHRTSPNGAGVELPPPARCDLIFITLAKACVVVISLCYNFVFVVAFVTLVAITVTYLIHGLFLLYSQLILHLGIKVRAFIKSPRNSLLENVLCIAQNN